MNTPPPEQEENQEVKKLIEDLLRCPVCHEKMSRADCVLGKCSACELDLKKYDEGIIDKGRLMLNSTQKRTIDIIIICVLGVALIILLGSFYSADSRYEKEITNLRLEKKLVENELKMCEVGLEERNKPLEPGSLVAQVRALGQSMKDETDSTISFLKDMTQFMKGLPCRWAVSDWVARVEGAAQLPQGVFTLVLEAEKKGTPLPTLTRRQKRALVKALDENPLPKTECEEKEEQENDPR